jgi:prepilin-type N-terminal cleavage/methylation domain-containing protein
LNFASTQRAFTLIELLVVFAIIAVLVSSLMPTLRGSRQAARNVVCAQRMGQLAIIANIYERDNKDYFPRLSDRLYGFVNPSFDLAQELDKTWVDLFAELKYIDADLAGAGLPKSLCCPDSTFENDPTWAGQMPNYGFNFLLSPPKSLEARVGNRSFFGRPSNFNGNAADVIMIAETRHLDNPRGWYGAGNSSWVVTRHDGGRAANVVYLTGNVVSRKVRTDLPLEDEEQPFSSIHYMRQRDR